jgi:hypothetical protein
MGKCSGARSADRDRNKIATVEPLFKNCRKGMHLFATDNCEVI